MHRPPSRSRASLALLVVLGVAAGLPAVADTSRSETAERLRFEVTLTPTAAAGIRELGLEVPVSGRVYVIVSRDGAREPREQIDLVGVPFWGMDVGDLEPGQGVVVDTAGASEPGRPSDTGVIGYPLPSFDGLPAGEYRVQAFLNVYTRFRRADGHEVLLPAGYEQEPERRYPVIYLQGHFPGRRAPFGYGSPGRPGRSGDFTTFWDSAAAPPLIAVTFRDANPYYDTSYSVDSDNVGPYGTALVEELIPRLEEEFRIIPEPWARVLAGGSTGGWEALAMQVFHPDFFGGAWGWCPDPVDFRYHQIVDVYEDDNAYFSGNEWHRIERPNSRGVDGSILSTMRQENHMELAIGPNDRSGGQWAIWQAVFSPVGPDGFPLPVWDKATGAIDHEVADHWRRHWDLRALLQRRWPEIGPSLRGKLHVTVGDMDTYYLEEAVYLLEELLDSLEDPPPEATFEYGRRKPHCWIGSSPSGSGEDMTYPEFVGIAAEHLRSRAPEGAGWHP